LEAKFAIEEGGDVIMPGVIIRGRWAWIASIVLGAMVLVRGFIIFGVIFLILSFVTGGQTD